MRRRSTAGPEPAKTRRGKAVTLKRGNPPKAVRRRSLSASGLQEQLDRRTQELTEALAQQAVTADVLKVISRRAFDLNAVWRTLVESACTLCDAPKGLIELLDGDVYRLVMQKGYGEEFERYLVENPLRAGSNTGTGRAASTGVVSHIPDVLQDPDYRLTEGQRLGGYRSNLAVPLLREQKVIGVFVLARPTPGPFTPRQIALVETFADHAVIAIENARLFDEVQAKTGELGEALQQQTATAEVLKAISRSAFDLESVLTTLTVSAKSLCGAASGVIYRREGSLYRYAASHMDVDPAYRAHEQQVAIQADRGTLIGRVALEKGAVQIADAWTDPEYEEKDEARLGNVRAMLGVPLMLSGEPIGAFALARREPMPFSQREVELVTTFADQAVIAIENARLFDEVQGRTRDLQESLQQQTATADVLKVISRSAFDLQAVFDTLISSAVELSGASGGTICLRDGDGYRYLATSGMEAGFKRFLLGHPPTPGRASAAGRVLLSGNVESIPDVLEDPDYVLPVYELNKTRAVVGVPLLRKDKVEGALVLNRTEPGLFTARLIELLQTFADQAVIAIENARLFDEVQARTRDLTEALTYQTGSSKILSVIASSPTDVRPVLNAIVESACELCEAYDATVVLKDGDELVSSAHHGPIPMIQARWPNDRNAVSGRAVADRLPVHLRDVLSDEGAEFPTAQEMARLNGFRSILGVPMIRSDEAVGAILLRRTEVHPFSDKQISLLRTFADQAVIAIGNVRMFEQVEERTKELSLSLDELRGAQERLIQTEKLASLGQLTAGIAHEIKNPLNFVNNFSSLSAELIDELDEALAPAPLDQKMRGEVGELTQMLKSNLEKVVQHGKRADSIVKNMLLHSRTGSGEHRSTDINALVEESLNLAYHGARAERPGFKIVVQQNLDSDAGAAELYPQEITRVLLNLIANGFYAATKRKIDGDENFEATLSATTRNLGNRVEIRIRDNGTGIPPEVKEKIFNPFFTTKPAGEGTGLGLSMSHDIIVKQHGGKIDVETEPGVFTEFIVTLPRKAAARTHVGESD
jgi:two-component system, NtrC family, sensor kinase